MEDVKLVDLLIADEEHRKDEYGYTMLDNGVDVYQLAETVMNGIRSCNLHDPTGWVNRVNLAQLAMSDSQSCILGQAFGWGAYHDMIEQEGNDYEYDQEWIEAHGFDVHGNNSDKSVQWTYRDLSWAWTIALENYDHLAGV